MPASPLLAPRYWGFHLLALVLVAIAGALGVWQLNAWQAHRAAEARDLTRVEPEQLTDVIGPDAAFPGRKVGQPVVVRGTWVPDATLYVSGREHDGHDGYWVMTPVAIDGQDGAALLVVRGWTDEVEDAPPAPTGETGFVALLQPAEGTGAVDDDPNDDVLPQVRLADALQHVDQDLYGAYAVVADEVADGDWPHGDTAINDGTDGLSAASLDQLPEVGRTTALRNLLYAIEWWVFGLFAGFIWWRWVKDETERLGSAA
ncbi:MULTISPECIES: SURF1 family protein [unclassified Nocardioides]|uniref:SURF1 family protein n=1 Tax=unclassified Nocardioides TaxID=2615069 RepID=UPI000A6D761C|nr:MULTISPECIES: SURF1 family protein [unclassified Nocardioides]